MKAMMKDPSMAKVQWHLGGVYDSFDLYGDGEYDTCAWCGKQPIRWVFDLYGETDTEVEKHIHVGSECARMLLHGENVRELEAKVKAYGISNSREKRQWFDAGTWQDIGAGRLTRERREDTYLIQRCADGRYYVQAFGRGTYEYQGEEIETLQDAMMVLWIARKAYKQEIKDGQKKDKAYERAGLTIEQIAGDGLVIVHDGHTFNSDTLLKRLRG